MFVRMMIPRSTPDPTRPLVFCLASSTKDQKSFENHRGGVFSEMVFDAIACVSFDSSVDTVMKKVQTQVQSEIKNHTGETQTPVVRYYGSAKGSELMHETIASIDWVLMVVPTYEGQEKLPGIAISAEKFLNSIAQSQFNCNCRFKVFADDDAIKVSNTPLGNKHNFMSRVDFFDCNQTTVRSQLEETCKTGENVMLFIGSHGKHLCDDEYVVFPRGDPDKYITGQYLGDVVSKIFKGKIFISMIDMCLSGGMLDPPDVDETEMKARYVHETTVLAPVEDPIVARVAEPSKTKAIPPAPLASDDGMKARHVGVTKVALTKYAMAILNSLAVAWSFGTGVMASMPAFFGVNAPAILFVPLFGAGVVLAISGVVAFGFYLHFMRLNYTQILSPVILTALLSVAVKAALGSEILMEWFSPDTDLGVVRGSVLCSLLVLTITIILNWRTIKRSESAMLFAQAAAENSADIAQLAMLGIHMYFVGGGAEYKQTLMFQRNGTDYYAVYHPLDNATRRMQDSCSFRLPSGYFIKPTKRTSYTLFNETYGLTCQYEVFLFMARNFSRGQPETLVAWERDGQVYNLRLLQNSRSVLLKNFGLGAQDLDHEKLGRAFQPRLCEVKGMCFHAPVMNPTWDISYVEKGLDQISEPFHRFAASVNAGLSELIGFCGRRVWALAYPRSGF